MPRFALLVVVLAMTLAACASDSSPTPAAGASTTTADPSSGGADPPSDQSGDPEGERGPLAPEIVLALGEGGTFVLSEEQKPVYMVFWAEW